MANAELHMKDKTTTELADMSALDLRSAIADGKVSAVAVAEALGAAAEDGEGAQVATVIETGLREEGLGLGRQGARGVVDRLRHQAGAQGSGADGVMVDVQEPGGASREIGRSERGGRNQDGQEQQGQDAHQQRQGGN